METVPGNATISEMTNKLFDRPGMLCGICGESPSALIYHGMLICCGAVTSTKFGTNDVVRRCTNPGVNEKRSFGGEVEAGGVLETRVRSDGRLEMSRNE